MRHHYSRARGHQHRAEANGNNNNWSQDIHGAQTELTFSKGTRLYWHASVGPDPGPDVGDWQIKGTATLNGHLIVQKPTNRVLIPHERYALMIVDDYCRSTFVGWCTAADAMAKGIEKPNAWWLHQSELHDVHEANLEFFDIHEEQALADYVQRRLSAVAA